MRYVVMSATEWAEGAGKPERLWTLNHLTDDAVDAARVARSRSIAEKRAGNATSWFVVDTAAF